MDHFVVPQFLDIEAKIIGPISARQFVIIAVSLGMCYVWYRFFPAALFIPLIFFTAGFGGALAFAKVNGQSMHYFMLNLIQTLKRPRLKLWFRSEVKKIEPPREATKQIPTKQNVGPVTDSRLAAMSLMVDTGGAYQADEIKPNMKVGVQPPQVGQSQQGNTNEIPVPPQLDLDQKQDMRSNRK